MGADKGGVVQGSSNTGYPADYPVLTTSYINHSFLSLVKKKGEGGECLTEQLENRDGVRQRNRLYACLDQFYVKFGP